MSTPQPVPQQQAQATGLVEIGEVAAANIVKRLKLDAGKPEAEVAKVVTEVKNAIRDEINAMSSHFTLAVSDVQTHYEAETLRLKDKYDEAVAAVKSDFNWVKANKVKIAAAVSAVSAVAALIGHFL